MSGYALGSENDSRWTRDGAMIEAGELAANGRSADSRAVYLWILARYPDDPEALFGLARVDAWGGCWELSDAEYRRVLSMHPEDADVRAGYVDLLVWRHRLGEARAALAQGLANDASSTAATNAALLARAAQFAYWEGDATTAVRLADDAERAAPDDGDVRAVRERMFRGEARVTTHGDFYPGTYLFSVAGQVLQRIGRLELTVGAQLLSRFVAGVAPIFDGRYPIDVAYHPALGVTLGVEIAPGAPAQAIPDFGAKAWAMFPLVGPLDGSMTYTFWHFEGGERVQVLNPALGLALPKEVRLEGRAWVSLATLGGQSKWVGAGGLQLTWTPTARVSAGATYTYGAEADAVSQVFPLNAAVDPFLDYTSHVGGLFADWLFDRHVGVRPVVGVERREDPSGGVVWITSVEAGLYARW